VAGALLIFACTYALIAARRLGLLAVSRPAAAAAGAAACVLFGILTPTRAYASIDGDTLVLLLSMMILAAHLDHAGAFDWGASVTLRTVRRPEHLLTVIVFAVGILSAFLVNDTVCFLMTPVIVRIIRRAQLGGLLFLMAVATSANIGSVMTIVGNPLTMIVGSLSQLSFTEYFAVMAPLGLACLALNRLLLPRFYPMQRRATAASERQAEWLDAPFDDADELPSGFRLTLHVQLRRGLLVKCGVSVVAALTGFFLGLNVAWTALGAAALLLLLAGWEPRAALKRVDWQLLLFVVCLFVVVGGLHHTGASAAMFEALEPWLGDSAAGQAWKLTLLSALGCNLVGNIPWVLVATEWMPQWLDPRMAWLVLAMSATFAGNLLITSSLATVLVCDAGRDVATLSFAQHARYGTVITVLTLVVGTLWLASIA
jgi:Na+/H+ antiporter NhaD/arsenite permease-like protein